ncbi:MAG: hypothetical protein EPN26_13465 [Rhodospirillales bacterium]|nr:MAG: hypothetical protein EPN26_13465 [Rhodospirillales bacterium]
MNETSLGYFPEEDHSRGAVTRYVLPRLWAETAGYVVSEWFPYWFVDTWWDHIAAMIGNKIALPVAMRQNPNALGTTGMRDLELWTRLFHALEPERVAAAQNIRDRIYPQDSPAFKASLRQQEHWRRIVAEHSAIDPDLISRIEGEKAHTPPSERYLHAKRLAEAYLERLGGNAGSVNLR